MANLSPLSRDHPTDRILGEAPPIRALRAQIRHLVAFDAPGNRHVPTVLLCGETGTGKGLVARVIHDSGPRAQGPFIDVNCAAIPETLLEAELFGYEPGAFTDAKRGKPGLFEAASGGTLFLDEVDALPLALQGKFLTAIEEKRVRRLGAVTERWVDIKLIAATQVDLREHLRTGRFRADLYHRLAVVVVELPPLRERGEDLLVLAQQFLRRYAEVHGLRAKRLSKAAEAWLGDYAWPGNVRELSHFMERVTLLSTEDVLDAPGLERLCLPGVEPAAPEERAAAGEARLPLDEARRIRQALARTGGNVVRAARLLGMSRNALRYRMRRYGIGRPSWEEETQPPAAGDDQASPDLGSPRSESTGENRQTPAPGREQKSVVVSGIEPEDRQMIEAPKEEAPDSQPEPLLPPNTPQGGEWKVVTVLCCALAQGGGGHTPPGPAVWYRLLRALYTLVEPEVKRYGGTLQPLMGDQIIAVFGAPIAQEDHAQRAVLAALAIQQRLRDNPGERLEVQMGLHTGRVVVGGIGGTPGMAAGIVGETIMWALAFQAHAAPGMILCSQATARLVQGRVRVSAMGEVGLPRQSSPIPSYLVLGRRVRYRALIRREKRAWSPFVGRQRELATLLSLFEQVREGRGQVVGIIGEPGIGKSRLIYEFHRSLPGPPVPYLACRCLSHTTTTPYLPIRDLLLQTCGLLEGESPEITAAKLRATLEEVGLAPEPWTPYLLQVLGLPAGGEPLATLSPQAIKARTVDALVQLPLHGARRGPLLLGIEDLHWIDPTSQEVLAALVERLMNTRILLLLTYRPGYRPPWIDKSYATQLALTPLDRQNSCRVVQAIIGTRSLPEPTLDAILARAEGNPLFLEELAHTVVEQADSAQKPMVPATLQAVLTARIDRLLPEAKRLLHVAAVMGKEIPVPLLEAVVKMPQAILQRHLHDLQEAELLYEITGADAQTVTFKHILIREAAYQSMLEETRQLIHRQIAQIAVERFPKIEETQPEWLAHHCTEAGLNDQAISYWKRAGQYALDRSAHTEAIAHLSRGLEVLGRFPQTAERIQRELDLLALLGPALMATKGYGARQVEETYARARELCQQLGGETPYLFPVVRGLWGFYFVRGELQIAYSLAEQLLRLAHALQDPMSLVVASYTVGATLFHRGELLEARAHLDREEHWYAFDSRRSDRTLSIDHGLTCLLGASWVLHILGYPDQALQKSRQALCVAKKMAHPFGSAAALSWAARLHQFRREPQSVQELAETLIALSTDQGFSLWLGLGREQQAWALIVQGQQVQGQQEEGVKLLWEALAANRATGRQLTQTYQLGLLAEAYGQMGRAEEGLRTVAETLALVERTGERFGEAELHRIKGELLLLRDLQQNTAAAETSFCRALEISRRQEARWWELRAATSLCRLWQRWGKHQTARKLLTDIYGGFSEGFDTVDLQEARALLAELS